MPVYGFYFNADSVLEAYAEVGAKNEEEARKKALKKVSKYPLTHWELSKRHRVKKIRFVEEAT